jgi:hypothetical protein
MSVVVKSPVVIKGSTRVGPSTSSSPSGGFDILSFWGVSDSGGVTLTNTSAPYEVPPGYDVTITGPLTLNDGVTLSVSDTSTLTVD